MNKRFGLFLATLEPNQITTKDYSIVLHWIFGISFSLIFFSIWALTGYLYIQHSPSQTSSIYFIIMWTIMGGFLFGILFSSTLKRCPKYDFTIDMTDISSLNPQISVIGVVIPGSSGRNTKVEYWVNIFGNGHKKIPLRTIGFSYESLAIEYAKMVSDYFNIPLKTDISTVKAHYKLLYIVLSIIFLPILFMWANIAYQYFTK